MSIIVILYFFIGFIVSIYFWEIFYDAKYKKTKNPPHGVAEILFLFCIFLWPICLYKILTRI